MTEIWFAGGTVADGSGSELSAADVCVEDGVITRIGTAPTDAEKVDLDGMLLTPGLIDAHVHLGLSSPIRAQFGFQLSAARSVSFRGRAPPAPSSPMNAGVI